MTKSTGIPERCSGSINYVLQKLTELEDKIHNMSDEEIAIMFKAQGNAEDYATVERWICGGWIVKLFRCKCGAEVLAQPSPIADYRWFCTSPDCPNFHVGTDTSDDQEPEWVCSKDS